MEDKWFTCKVCECEVPADYSLRTANFCYLCDPNISFEELLKETKINNNENIPATTPNF